ncbi:MAG: HEAT repeat domain-containing protein [Phycisphaerae bacterium]|nr:HEAT repeat domain-containing protein [Phycisphaerae bacterium]MDP7636530.1 HEAT repeat domain-containing protein [Phycisphaerae bacterium]
MIIFKCARCGVPMSVPQCLAGRSERCPSCGADIHVPQHQDTADGEIDLDALAGNLRHPDVKVRFKAAETLGQCRGPRAVEMLVQAFRDSDKFVREIVMESLRKIGDPYGVEMLVRDLGRHWVSAATVQEAVRELVKFGQAAGDPLIKILTETNKNPREHEPKAVRAAVMVLGRLGEKRAASLLAKMFRRHFDIHVRDEAAHSLAMVCEPEEYKKIQALPEGRRRTPTRELAKRVIRENHILV